MADMDLDADSRTDNAIEELEVLADLLVMSKAGMNPCTGTLAKLGSMLDRRARELKASTRQERREAKEKT